MPSYQKVGDAWRVQAMRQGVRYSKTFRSLKQAQAWAAGYEGTARNVVTLADAMRAYSAKVSPTKRASSKEHNRIARLLRELTFAGKPIDMVLPEEISDWRDEQLAAPKSPSSVKRDLTVLSAVFQWARLDRRWLQHNPCHAIRWPKNAPPRKRIATKADVKAILGALGWRSRRPESAQDQTAIAFLLALETAMRASEILGLTRDQLHLERRYLHLDKTKNGDERDVPLSKAAIRLLKLCHVIDGRLFQISAGTLDMTFRRAVRKAGLPDLHFHDSRRSAATRLSKRLDVLDLAKMTGHRDLRMLLTTYYSPDPTAAAKKLG